MAFAEKYWALILATVVSGLLLLWSFFGPRLSGMRELGTAQVVQLMNKDDPLIVDVRETKEFDGAKLPKAVHIPLSQLASRAGELAKFAAKPVVAYCARGNRSAAAGKLLARQGFKDVYQLRGGIKAWRDASMPVDKA